MASSKRFLDSIPNATADLVGRRLCKFEILPDEIYQDYEGEWCKSGIVNKPGRDLFVRYIRPTGWRKTGSDDSGDEKILRLNVLPSLGFLVGHKLSTLQDVIDIPEIKCECKFAKELPYSKRFKVCHVEIGFSTEARKALAETRYKMLKALLECWQEMHPEKIDLILKFATGNFDVQKISDLNLPPQFMSILERGMSFNTWFSGNVVALYLSRERTFLFIPKLFLTNNAKFVSVKRGDMKFDVSFTYLEACHASSSLTANSTF